MEINQFILLDKAKVRRNSNLMSLYLEFFESTFNYKPSCAGCSFGSDWNKLVVYYSKNKEKSVTLQKQKVMNGITIKKIKGVILAYKKDGKTYRSYDNILSQEFIQGYLSNGNEDELKERNKMFNFPLQFEFTVDTSKAENKIEELKNTLNEKSTESEINKEVEAVIELVEVQDNAKPKGKRGRKLKK